MTAEWVCGGRESGHVVVERVGVWWWSEWMCGGGGASGYVMVEQVGVLWWSKWVCGGGVSGCVME